MLRAWESENSGPIEDKMLVFVKDKLHFLEKKNGPMNNSDLKKNDTHFEVEEDQLVGGFTDDSDNEDQSEIIDLTTDC